MTLTDLYEAIKLLGPQNSFYLNNPDKINTFILEYNKKRRCGNTIFWMKEEARADLNILQAKMKHVNTF